jgi:hypothetical protein
METERKIQIKETVTREGSGSPSKIWRQREKYRLKRQLLEKVQGHQVRYGDREKHRL